MVSKVLNFYVTGKEKAVVGSWVAALVAFLLQHFGWHTSNVTQQLAISGIILVVTHLAVYLEKNTKVQKVVADMDKVGEELDIFPTTATTQTTLTAPVVEPPVSPDVTVEENNGPQIPAPN